MNNTIYFFVFSFVFSLFSFSCIGDDALTQDAFNSAPSSFETTVTDRQRKSVSVSWSESIDPEGKAITYSVYKDGAEVSSGLTQKSFVFENLPINQSFFVTIRAIDEDGQSQVSQVLEAEVLPSYPPTEFQVFNRFKSTIDFNSFPPIRFEYEISWTSSSDPDGGLIVYDIVADIPPKKNISLVTNLTGLMYLIPISNLTQGANTNVYVTARDEDGMTRTVSTSFEVECYNEVCPYRY